MGTVIFNLFLKLLTSSATEKLIGIGVNKLLTSTSGGIKNDLAKTLINGVANSKLNPTTDEVFNDALKLLK